MFCKPVVAPLVMQIAAFMLDTPLSDEVLDVVEEPSCCCDWYSFAMWCASHKTRNAPNDSNEKVICWGRPQKVTIKVTKPREKVTF